MLNNYGSFQKCQSEEDRQYEDELFHSKQVLLNFLYTCQILGNSMSVSLVFDIIDTCQMKVV